MTNDIIIYLPWPPTVNNYYRTARSGHKYLDKSVIRFRKAVAKAIHEQVPGLVIDEPVFLDVVLHPPDRRQRDLDNYQKGLLDSITDAKLLTNDELIDQLHIYRGVVVKGGVVKVEMSEAGPLIPFDG